MWKGKLVGLSFQLSIHHESQGSPRVPGAVPHYHLCPDLCLADQPRCLQPASSLPLCIPQCPVLDTPWPEPAVCRPEPRGVDGRDELSDPAAGAWPGGCCPGPPLRQLRLLGRAAATPQGCSPGPPGQGKSPACPRGTGHRLLWRTTPAQWLKNWVVAEDVVFKPVAAPWSPEHQLQRPQLTRQVLGREDLTAFSLQSPLPRYLYLASNQTNAWGHQRGYRIQIHSPLGIHMPLESDMERALSWGRYQLVVTRRKEEESQSSSIYYQNDIWTPTMAFADFINNETLLGEDLVAWVTASFLHIPHAEDVPNTVTVGNRVGFLLRPYNFFDEDPSIFSPGSIYFEKGQDAGLCSVNPVACIPHLAACVPDLPPFSYQDF
nr:PREDICTED: retina-specific copper amine oxidase isoform X3 [Equus przewalskii]